MTSLTAEKTNETVKDASKAKKTKLVVKLGGSLIQDPQLLSALVWDIKTLLENDMSLVLVHGGGANIEASLKQQAEFEAPAGKAIVAAEKINGLRVTDSATLKVVAQVLSEINSMLVGQLAAAGVYAAGIVAPDSTLLKCQKLICLSDNGQVQYLGFVGKITDVDCSQLEVLLEEHEIVVIAPLALDESELLYNINADHAALAVASALKADKFINMTDVPGLLLNSEDPASLISEINSHEVEELKAKGNITSGMLPKIESCLEAIVHGVGQVQIISGKVEHSLLKAACGDESIGTTICQGAG